MKPLSYKRLNPPKCSYTECTNLVPFNKTIWGYNKCCSRSCAMKLKWITSTSLRENQKEAVKKSCKKNWENPEYVKILKEAASKTFKKLWLDESFRENCTKRSSDNLKNLWSTKRNWIGSIKGHFESKKSGLLPYRSSLELNAYTILENRDSVKSIEVEALEVPYLYKGKLRNYYPDILVTYNNGLKEVIEVKPEYFISKDKNIHKFLSCIDYCKSRDMKFTVWTNFNWPTS